MSALGSVALFAAKAPAEAEEGPVASASPTDFVHSLRYEDIPDRVLALARLAVLDLLGVAVAGSRTALSAIVRDYAVEELGGGAGSRARLLFDGRHAGIAAAAFAGASTIDAFDAHDGHRLTKGHAGVALLPALLAWTQVMPQPSARAFLTTLIVGYEIAHRAGIALHGSVSDYHTSGAWNALGVAAMGARLLGLDKARTRHALGIAEYHGPRSQMMRCIAHPTMLKDGSGWGALAGVSAVGLAARGFTGAPAVTIEADEAHADLWKSLCERWTIEELYFKPYPVCRWAQPAIEAVAGLMADAPIDPAAIVSVEIETFAAGVSLGCRHPATTEEAQYALGFPLAAFLAKGRLDAASIDDAALADPAIAAVLETIALSEDASMTRRFPAERVARAVIRLANGEVRQSPVVAARGDPETPFGEAALIGKFRDLSQPLDARRRDRIEASVLGLGESDRPLGDLLDLILSPIDRG